VKVGFDAKRFFNNFTGLGNYSRFVIRALSEHAPANEYLLFTPKIKAHPELNSILSSQNLQIITPPYVYTLLAAGSIWRTWGISKSPEVKGLDVYHGLSQELPVQFPETVKKVVTMHDLIFMRYPHLYKSIDAAIYKAKAQAACRNADRILAISQQTRDDIVHFLHADPAKIDVVYQGCHPTFKKVYTSDQITAIRVKYDLPRHYILSVGTIEERKNVLLLVRALALLPIDLRMHVVVIGRSTNYKRKIIEQAARLRVSQWILFFHNVSFSDLPAIYQAAEVFVYPSIFEGFGIPIVEALESSVPVIAATGSALREAGGPGTIYVDPEDAQEMYEQLRNVLSDDALRKRMVANGLDHARKFEPAVIADQIVKIYETV
jgi:glycosyltransferase involved in cell wall biosynthesis